MDKEKLNEILEKHKKWLNKEDGGECADLSSSDMRYSDLRGSDLRGSNLRGSNLSGSNLRGSNLSDSDLSHSDLRGSNLIHSDLSHSDLSGSNIDYACWPLWCGSLDAHIDDRIARQLLYHLMRPCLVSPYVSDDFKRALFTKALIAEANKFHRAEECGLIENPYGEDDHGQSN